MKILFTLFSGLMLLTGTCPASSGADAGTAEPGLGQAAELEDAKTRQFKDILFKLIRQDGYLDEALETPACAHHYDVLAKSDILICFLYQYQVQVAGNPLFFGLMTE